MTRTLPPNLEAPTEPSEPAAALQEQIDELDADIIASVQRLATDEEHRKAIQKLLV